MKQIKLWFFLVLLGTTISRAQSVDTLTIQSKIFDQTRKIKVLLPKGYGQYNPDYPNKDKAYIVAYLFDAQSDNLFNFYKATVTYLTQQYYLQPLILVAISSSNRQYEFTPKAQTEEGAKSFAKNGGADLLAMHLRDEVMPLIKSKYRVKSYNIGIGHSLGATFVTYSMLKFPEIFNAGIVISPNFHYDQEQMVHKFDSLANEKTFGHKFFYMAYGHTDETEEKFKPSSEKVAALLKKKNIPGLKWQVKAMDNDSHGLTPMEGIFKGLAMLNREFTLSDNQVAILLNDKKKPFIDNVKDFYKSASSWSGIKLPVAEDVNLWGYNLVGKHNKESIDLFNWFISLYPNDDNIYDSIGEIERSIGDKTAALKYYSTGLEVLKKQKDLFDTGLYNRKIAGFEKNINSLKN